MAKPKTKKAARQPITEAFNFDSVVSLIKQDRSTIDLKAVGDEILTLRSKVTEHPQDPALRARLAACLYLGGDLDGASIELKRSIALRSDDDVSHVFLARILDEVGDRESATREFRRAIDLAPQAADPHFLFAESLMKNGEVSPAINEYRRAIDLKPSAEAYSVCLKRCLACTTTSVQ